MHVPFRIARVPRGCKVCPMHGSMFSVYKQRQFHSPADPHSKKPRAVGLQVPAAPCHTSIPPLADIHPVVMSRVLFGGVDLAHAQQQWDRQ